VKGKGIRGEGREMKEGRSGTPMGKGKRGEGRRKERGKGERRGQGIWRELEIEEGQKWKEI
jgi:hypothetical protein